nr:single-stranded DNA-binding protein [Streptococcus infantis]
MINNVTLIGRLVAPPELKKMPNNVSVLQGTLAVNRNFKNENGDREADFIQFQAWRGTADIIAQYCSKGSLIGLTGRIQTRSYDNQQGQRVYVTEVVAESFQILEKKDNSANRSSMENQMPPSFGSSDPMDIPDDGLPF